jgi:hypothetical protein
MAALPPNVLVQQLAQNLTGPVNLYTLMKAIPWVCEWLERFCKESHTGPQRKLLAMEAYREFIRGRTELSGDGKQVLLGLVDMAVNIGIDLVCDGAGGHYRINGRAQEQSCCTDGRCTLC